MAAPKKLIVGNWKMYPQTLTEAKRTFSTFKRKRHFDKGVTTVFCPPYLYLADLAKSYTGSKLFFGAQDIFWQPEGAYTGEISIPMIKSVGTRFVILGHSERRALGENDELIAQKVKAALKEGLHVILCIGEPTRDAHGHYLRFLQEQLQGSLRGVSKQQTKKLVIAYEPIWAIGKGKKAMQPHEIHQMVLYIRKQLVSQYGRTIGMKLPILYGGSVNEDNAHTIVYEGDVDGLLIGRKSLNPHAFADIIEAVARKPKK